MIAMEALIARIHFRMNHADYGTHVDIWLERISIFNFDFAEYDMDSFHHHVVQGVWTSFTMVRDVIRRI